MLEHVSVGVEKILASIVSMVIGIWAIAKAFFGLSSRVDVLETKFNALQESVNTHVAHVEQQNNDIAGKLDTVIKYMIYQGV